MTKNQRGEVNTQVLDEVRGQPQALNEWMQYYTAPEGLQLLQSIDAEGPLMFTGMGASFHAAQVGAQLCCAAGADARAVETSELIEWPVELFARYSPIIYLSQSGASPEVLPLLGHLQQQKLIAVTNSPESPLAQSATLTLPLLAGEENWIASKTYMNSLAAVWLLSSLLTTQKTPDPSTIKDKLNLIRRRLQVIFEASDMLMQRWQALLEGADKLILLGDGLQAISARQTALLLAEWARVTATAQPLQSFKHGYVELLEQGTPVLVFESSSAHPESHGDSLHWMESLGANVIRVRDGFPQAASDTPQPAAGIEPGLSPILDAAAAQLLVIQMAQSRGIDGWRYISKIVE
jgi:glutamine---fructose-6-phosphate transaminase (isomerizing)